MKFLLIGGLGYIGQVLQQEIKKAGHTFEIIDNDLFSLHNGNDKLDIINYGHFEKISSSIKDSDIIVHLAAIVGDPACLVDTRLAIETNCQGVQHIVNLCNKYSKKIVLLSTCSLYGSSDEILIEESPTFPVDFYGQTKYQQERYVLENANDYCVFRLGTIYGYSPRMRFDLVINNFVAKAHNNEKLSVFGGEQWRPFVHVRDAARGIIFAAEKNLKGVYNLANENVKIMDLAKKISSNIDVNEFMSDPRNYKASNEKILKEDFEFKYSVDKGIEEINNYIEHLRSYKDVKYSNYKLMVLRNLQAKG